jgi:phosphoglucomutase
MYILVPPPTSATGGSKASSACLVENRGWKNGVAKSVATTNLINAIAKARGVELYATPLGFKYIGELIMQDKIAIGGEESAGLSVRHHVPEKDGLLAGFLCCEMVARRVFRRAIEGLM